MIEKSITMSFRDPANKKVNLTIKDVREIVEETDIEDLMNSIISDELLQTVSGKITVKEGAEIVTKDTQKVDIAK